MNLERMKQAAISSAKEHDKYAVVCTDGDYEYARTVAVALDLLDEMVDMRDTVVPANEYDYGLVRVDPTPEQPGGHAYPGP